jgi:6,7-dimethyl-8-ribityllumazine synthase
MSIRRFEGDFRAGSDARIAICAARFNHAIVDRLVDGALDCLGRHGVAESSITLTKVPGAFELPWAVQRHAASGKSDAVIALGAVIRGATPHFEYVSGEASSGLMAVMRETGVPVAFGLLTTETIEQAVERSGTKAGNKGWDAAMTALEMIALSRALRENGV